MILKDMLPQKFKFTFNWALFALFVILFVTIAAMNSSFLYPDYIIGVMLRNIVEIGLVAFPMTLIIITGGIDLSVGSIMVLSAIIGGMAAEQYGSVMGLVITLLVGLVCGLINGFIIAKLKISPLVATLATMYLFLGVARGISLGDSVYSYPISEFMGTTYIGIIPMQIFVFILFAIVFYLLLAKTTLGRKIYGIGLNENATKYSGIDTDKTKILIYVLSGFMSALAALIWLGRFTSIKYDAGNSLAFSVVTVIVLGGTSILGGYGNIIGTIFGTLIIAVLNSGLTVLNIPIDSQTIVHGIVLVISLVVYALMDDRVKKSKFIKINTKQGALPNS